MSTLWQTKRREILAGVACLLLVLLAAYVLWPERVTVQEESDIGTMRMAEVLAAHPSYARLNALRAEERTLTMQLHHLPAAPEIDPPEIDPGPFEDSVWQKNAQTVISTRVELEREQKRLTEIYRKQTEADYEARKKAIDDEYLNAILNINLKIDNQRAMHDPEVSAEELARERAAWEAERDVLKRARGERQMILYRQWQEEIRARVAAQIEPKQAAWMRSAQETVDAQKAEADRLRAAVEERSKEEMARALAAQEDLAALSARVQRLAAVRAEADALEAGILRDVRSRAAKLALQHHLALILASPEADTVTLLPDAEAFAVRRYAPIISAVAMDLTVEMVREMQRVQEARAE